jgi:DNA-binding protein Fis
MVMQENQAVKLLNINPEMVCAVLKDRNNSGKVYEMLLNEFEKAVLEEVMVCKRGNQTKAAEVLGLNRGTLRKKLNHLGLM